MICCRNSIFRQAVDTASNASKPSVMIVSHDPVARGTEARSATSPLKDRTLSIDNIMHYQHIIVALSGTAPKN